MKKIFALLMSIFMLIQASIICIPVSAKNTSVANLEVSTENVYAGDAVYVTVSLTSNPGLTYVKLKVSYDTQALTLFGVQNGEIIEDLTRGNAYVWSTVDATTATGTFATLIFYVSESAFAGTYPVTITCTEASNYQNDVPIKIQNGSIIVNADECVHDMESISYEEPTCKTAGYRVLKCTKCDYSETITFDVIDCAAQDEADCVNNAECKYCGKVLEDAHGHNYRTQVIDPTATEEGYTLHTCMRCGDSYQDGFIPPMHNHAYGAWTKYDDTHHKRTCSCGDMQTAPHEWDKGTVLKNPTATEEGLKVYTCLVCGDTKNESIPVVLIPVTGISLAETRLTLEEGDILNLTATIFPSNATNQAVVWTSDNPAIARVAPFANSTAARIYAEQEGIATITVKTVDGSYMATCVVTVTSPEPDVIPVTGITLSESAVTVRVGDGKFINATIFPDNATNKLVNWTCSDPTVADIGWAVGNKLQGAIIAKAEGTAVITVSTADGAYTAQCMVTVVANPNAPTICINNETASAGKTVQVNIALKNNPGIASMKLKVAYDESILTLQQIVYNSAMGGQSQQPQNLTSPVTLNWYNGAANSNGDFVYATLTFLVKDGAQAGETDITVTYDPEDVYNIDFDNINFAVQNGQITIVDHIPGDVSGDGAVNNKDLSLLFQYLSDWNVTVNKAALDINGDGKVNNKDLSLLFQYLSDWDVEIY